MNKTERQELAIDIARRVRLYCVQPLARELLDALSPGQYFRFSLDAMLDREKVSPATYLAVDLTTSRTGSLEFVFYLNDQIVQRVRFDPPDEIRELSS